MCRPILLPAEEELQASGKWIMQKNAGLVRLGESRDGHLTGTPPVPPPRVNDPLIRTYFLGGGGIGGGVLLNSHDTRFQLSLS